MISTNNYTIIIIIIIITDDSVIAIHISVLEQNTIIPIAMVYTTVI